MSRVAEAVERAALLARGASFSDDDHPWGSNLGDASPEPVVPPAIASFERFHAVPPPTTADRAVTSLPRRVPPVTPTQPTVALDDSHRTQLAALVERIFLPVSGEPPRSVAFSGLGADSGIIAAAAGELLTHQTNATVCVVDANFSTPSLHVHFGAPHATGLSDRIASGEPLADAAREVRPNLWLLPAGSSPGRPSLGSDSARVRLAQFIARFDFVLVDIEPVCSPGDAAGFAPLVDGVILVLAADATRRESAKRTAQVLHGAGASVLGAVLTNRRFPIPDALYRRL